MQAPGEFPDADTGCRHRLEQQPPRSSDEHGDGEIALVYVDLPGCVAEHFIKLIGGWSIGL